MILALERAHLPNIFKRWGWEIPFADKNFDFAFMGHLLHEVEDPGAVLQETKRVTKHNIFILEWSYKEEKMGPPLNHRISSDVIKELFLSCDFGQCHNLSIRAWSYISPIDDSIFLSELACFCSKFLAELSKADRISFLI